MSENGSRPWELVSPPQHRLIILNWVHFSQALPQRRNCGEFVIVILGVTSAPRSGWFSLMEISPLDFKLATTVGLIDWHTVLENYRKIKKLSRQGHNDIVTVCSVDGLRFRVFLNGVISTEVLETAWLSLEWAWADKGSPADTLFYLLVTGRAGPKCLALPRDSSNPQLQDNPNFSELLCSIIYCLVTGGHACSLR